MNETLNSRKGHPQEVMADDLRRQIRDGVLKVGDYLLPERQLAGRYGVSSRVVRGALTILQAEGLISRRQGRGTEVLPLAGQVASRKNKNIAVIFLQRIRDSIMVEFFDSLQQTLQRGGYGSTLYVSGNDPEKETAIVNQLMEEGVPGMVLFTVHEANSFAHLKAAQDAGVKVALFDHYFPELPTNFVGINDRVGAYEATSHLIQLGCEELVFINSLNDWSTHTLRQRGFEDAVTKLGPRIPSRTMKVPMFKQMKEHIHEALSFCLPSIRGKKIGVLAWNNHAALHAMDCLQSHGLSVPGDAAVVGFADDLDSALASIPLTTVEIPREETARLCGYLILDQMRDPQLPVQHIELRPHLIIRESCGCYSRKSTERAR